MGCKISTLRKEKKEGNKTQFHYRKEKYNEENDGW